MHLRRRLPRTPAAAGAFALVGLSAALALVTSCDSRPVFPLEEQPDGATTPIVSREASADVAPMPEGDAAVRSDAND
jgi:hypothetical protein